MLWLSTVIPFTSHSAVLLLPALIKSARRPCSLANVISTLSAVMLSRRCVAWTTTAASSVLLSSRSSSPSACRTAKLHNVGRPNQVQV
ncbi:hypothetical protein PF010_g27805 [Phytophthora fragariae]|uniref:RxLR effector protein n=1 Tax=Phytophthora fragariae TaxID=53985 RepID=A0A6A4BDK4_9STRA|nr:hypothetical protein PF010_g27805 [Phytophthora fragariae]KAE9273189.1 hypothetical protein PF001_g27618 [Phytophthora fragariae]KAE9282434.1 hypothetical protein PF008_g27643 [Phytophthora fragariae]